MESIYANYPEYKSTARLDDLRATDYGYLDKQDHLYLDFTGAGLAAQSQLRAHESRLERTLLGNPHSENPTSRSATHLVEDARARILAHLGASPDEYTAVFTPNATGAARLVAEAYPWTRRSRLVLTADNHNSVNGLRDWYKLFGYPTGVGCLVVRRDALARLAGSRPWFSGGTIAAASVGVPWHVMAPDEAAFEDGTVNFLSIPDVRFGLDWLDGIGMDLIGTRVRCLTGWCLDRLRALQHGDGSPVVRIYGPTDMTARGGTICFNFLDVGGRIVDERLVAAESSARNISLRTGCFCNPGAGEAAFGLSKRVLEPLSRAQMQMKMQVQVMNSGGGGGGSADDYIRLLAPVGAVRISFGFVTTTGDVDRFIARRTGTGWRR
ncbi:aminotransferase class-V [Colletotrichum higginsianum]|nr:aminotransferase class-V [Colletotrichum higginsianum]